MRQKTEQWIIELSKTRKGMVILFAIVNILAVTLAGVLTYLFN